METDSRQTHAFRGERKEDDETGREVGGESVSAPGKQARRQAVREDRVS